MLSFQTSVNVYWTTRHHFQENIPNDKRFMSIVILAFHNEQYICFLLLLPVFESRFIQATDRDTKVGGN
jgi:hypothetical protein